MPNSTRLRVLLVGQCNGASAALGSWLRERRQLGVTGPTATTAEALGLAAKQRPHVVLLDFHGLPVSTPYIVTLLKELSPAPQVFVLNHDASAAMRRRCHAAHVDAVIDKTSELDLLATLLAGARESVTANPLL